MATGIADAETTAVSAEARYIEQQLDKTRLQVKLVDLFGGLMMLAVAVLSFLLLVSVVDAWLFDLTGWGRMLAFLLIILGGIAYLTVAIAPLIFRKVNPVYAARAIEHAEPGLKNGLINFLMFRGERRRVEAAVYQALEHQAAAGLSHVPIETAVDRTRLVRLGYALAGVVVVCGAYKILSPKDPFQTFARVAAPLAQIDRPTRVQIRDVKPGEDISVYYGTDVAVSARIRGLGEGGSATLIYSTADGQQVDRRVAMQVAEDSTRYQCQLATDSVGIQQDVIYRIEAGDALTRDYHVRVRTAPTITVESVRYDFPAYADRPPQQVAGKGDVSAIEGTQVSITAVANLPIQFARIELKSSDLSDRDGGVRYERTKTLAMSVNDRRAVGQFFLELRADRQTPVFNEYVVHFSTHDGYRNENPAEYRIEVIPDLAPDVEILAPRRERIEVPANKSQSIEVRALDPDFALRKVALRAASSGTDLLNAVLLDASPKANEEKRVEETLPRVDFDGSPAKYQGHVGQAIAAYEFRPRALKLKPGDEVVFWAVAEDNRTSVRHQLPEPNVSRTKNYYIRITPPETRPGQAANDEHPDETNNEDKNETKGQSAENDKGSEDPNGDGEDSTSAGNAEQRDSGKSDTGDASGGTSGSESDNADASEDSESGEGSNGSSSEGEPTGDSQNGGTNPTDKGNSAGTSAGNSSEKDQNSSAESNNGSADRSEAGGGNAGEGAGRSEANGNLDLDNAQVKQGDPNESEPAGSDEKLHDGEAFEKILEHLQNKQNESRGGGDPGGDDKGDSQDSTKGGASKRQSADVPQNSDASPADDRKSSAEKGNDGAQGDPSANQNGENDVVGGSPDPNGDGSHDPSGDVSPDPPTTPSSSAASQRPNDGSRGQGEKSEDGTSGDPQGPAKTGKDEPQDAQGSPKKDGNSSGETGDAGAGRESDSETGSPQSQGENRDHNKTAQGDDAGSKKGEEAKSPSTSEKQSDSRGENAGDRSGGGGEGGGQDANQAGRDTSGSNTSADSGAGASDEQGDGETSESGGDDRQAAGETGSKGESAGGGSDSRSNPDGDNFVQRPGDHAGNGQANPHGGGGTADTAGGSPLASDAEITPGEKAKLEHAEKATDLALDYLRDKNAASNRELLDKLGWTDEEMKNFVERWTQLKRKAREGSTTDERELNRSLRSLGLRPSSDQRRAASATDDQFRDLRDDGYRPTVPAKYLEQFKAFQRGAARAENDRGSP